MCEKQELREKNRATVEEFFKRYGEPRAELFDIDGAKEIVYNANGGASQCWKNKEEVLENFISNKSVFPKWAWNVISIDSTEDPNKFWVEANGSGEVMVAGKSEPSKYENHYFFCFEMKDGLILKMREIMNPLKLLEAFGVEVPKM